MKIWLINASLCTLVLCATPQLAQAEAALRVVSVSGEAEVKVIPDQVVVTLGLETRNKNLAEVKRLNDNRIKDVIARMVETGVVEKDIQTDYINLEPEYDTNPVPKKFIDYAQRTTLVVTLRDVSKFTPLMTAVLQGGVEFIHGVDFQTSQLRQHRDEARVLAVKAAKEKATAMAAELGQKVGRPQSIQEGYAGWSSSYGRWWGRGYAQNNSQNVSQNVVQSSTSSSENQNGALAPGALSVRASVNITFELE
jgi:uncharacterized protein